MAALIALAQTDIKKVLAYSTLSQLGYMILAMGVGSWVGGLFHLITHAFFKALLFLGSGSVIHAAHHEQELPQYGGLIRKDPDDRRSHSASRCWRSRARRVFRGYLQQGHDPRSTPARLRHLAEQSGRSHRRTGCSSFCRRCIAYVTAFYMTRCWMLTFWGKPRNQHLYDHAHESPIMWIPLVVLAILASIIGGKFLVRAAS